MFRFVRTLMPALVLLAASPSLARAESLVVCSVGGPGGTEQARPVLDQFLRHLERASGLKAGSMIGEYHTTLAGCRAYIEKASPALGVFDLGTFLAHSTAWQLKPLAHMGKADSQRYHLLVPKGLVRSIAELKGRSLMSTVEDPLFAGRVVLDNKLDLKAVTFKSTSRAMKALREVARKKADAALVEELAYTQLAELKLPVELVSIQTSPGLPGLTLAVLAQRGGPELTAKITAALPKLCAGDGKKQCETFRIESFSPVKGDLYTRLQQRYDGK